MVCLPTIVSSLPVKNARSSSLLEEEMKLHSASPPAERGSLMAAKSKKAWKVQRSRNAAMNACCTAAGVRAGASLQARNVAHIVVRVGPLMRMTDIGFLGCVPHVRKSGTMDM
jgi:hypothetical protein